MISLPLLVLSLAERAKALKEDIVRKAPEQTMDAQAMPPIMSWERMGTEIAVALAPKVDRDEGLKLAWMGIGGFAADAVVFGVDAFQSSTLINPATGEQWDEGQMQTLAAQDPELARRTLGEELFFIRVTRSGARRVTIGRLPYRVTERSVAWLPTKSPMLDGEPGGFVVASLREAFQRPTTLSQAIDALGPPEKGSNPQKVIDLATLRAMRQMGATVASNGTGG